MLKEDLHEIFPIYIESSDLKHVQNIMDIRFSEAIRENSSNEVRVALVVKVIST